MLRASRRKIPESGAPDTSGTPFRRFLAQGQITRIELAARSGVNLRALKVLADDDEAVYRLPVSTVVRVAVALGCAPVELLPSLGKRPRQGLLWERGIFRRERTSNYTG